MPGLLPEALEAGTVPTPAVAGLLAGLSYIESVGMESIQKGEREVIDRIRYAFEGDRRVVTYSKERGSIWLFCVKGQSPQKTALLLDREGICVRAGLHCAPLAHKTLNTPEDGAVRVSAGPLNTLGDSDRFIRALRSVISGGI